MSQGRPRDPRKEEQWRHWIVQWRGSGSSVRAFCQQHHLSVPSFYAWRRKLQSGEAKAGPFVPVQLIELEQAAPTSLIELVLPGGVTLRLPPRFDPVAVRQLLGLLGEGR